MGEIKENTRKSISLELAALQGKIWKIKTDEEFVVGCRVYEKLTGKDLPPMYFLGLPIHCRSWIDSWDYFIVPIGLLKVVDGVEKYFGEERAMRLLEMSRNLEFGRGEDE